MTKKKIDIDHLTKEIIYSEHISNPCSWIDKGEELLAAANILERDIVEYWSNISVKNGKVKNIPNKTLVQGSYFLLIAYALENYLKALLIYRHRSSLKNRVLKKLPPCIKKNHNLLELVNDVNLTIDISETELLLRLGYNTIWSARYPVPTDPTALSAMDKFSDGRYHLIAYHTPNDIGRVRSFVDRVRGMVTKEIGSLHK